MEKIDNVNIEIVGGELEMDEIKEYIRYVKSKYKDETLLSLKLTLDGEFVDLHYHLKPQPVERIRRITGYLVGTLDRFNDAKATEEKDRLKHSL